jgi:spectinomycin phosphotransferase
MRDEPPDLTCGQVTELLRRHWSIKPADVSYAPVGYGSYHWVAADHDGPRWFVTADCLRPGGSLLGATARDTFTALVAAAQATRQLADQGCEFVLAPLPDRTDVLVRRVLPGWTMQVFPYLSGWSTEDGYWHDPVERARVAELVGRLHAAMPLSAVRRWDFAIPARAPLRSALADLDRPWSGGPYAEPTRTLLAATGTSIRARFRRYDALVAHLTVAPDPWVVTHGEPDSANVLRTDDGRMLLIDWCTMALAPRERDLVDLLDGSPEVLAAYQRAAGPVAPRPAAFELFRLWWMLAQIGDYVQLFRHPHGDSADNADTWRNLYHRAYPDRPA